MVFPDSDPSPPQSAAVTALQAIYGQPSQAGFGSAVFDERIATVPTFLQGGEG